MFEHASFAVIQEAVVKRLRLVAQMLTLTLLRAQPQCRSR